MPGISGFAIYVPPHRVHLKDWCEWNDQPWGKIGTVIGESFRVCGPEQDVYTLAATAALRLIRAYDVDPASIGQLVLGTESASDNAAGSVIVRGMLDQQLQALGQPPLARDCEVPEIKHACLGGVYALKYAARYLATDGAGRRSIVVSADIAEYAAGSSGEPTQGAGAVAMLLDDDARLLEIDLAAAGGASSYRGLDFRKPFARFSRQPVQGSRLHDYPVFNGRYSTACYFDTVRNAVASLRERRGGDWRDALSAWDAVFMHRPYARMPETALGLVWLHALAADADPVFESLCADLELDAAAVRTELAATPDLAALRAQGRLDIEVYPQAHTLLRHWRKTDDYSARVTGSLGAGEPVMRALGNLYTAALPAWLATGLAAGYAGSQDLTGQQWLAVGYGSGDAAELLALTVARGWRDAAAGLTPEAALDGASDLDVERYQALHGGGGSVARNTPVANAFVIDSVGELDGPDWADAGVATYRFVQ